MFHSDADAHGGRCCTCSGLLEQEIHDNLYLLFDFPVNLKLLLKIKCFLKTLRVERVQCVEELKGFQLSERVVNTAGRGMT